MSANDYQVGGDHYASKSVQPWEAMEAWMTKEAFSGFLCGNCIKYIARYNDKGGVEDLEKAQHYLAKLMEVEGGEDVASDPRMPETLGELTPRPEWANWLAFSGVNGAGHWFERQPQKEWLHNGSGYYVCPYEGEEGRLKYAGYAVRRPKEGQLIKL